eukprot:4265114-Prymnesium_polylepis.1
MEANRVVNLKPLQGTPQYAPAKARNFGYITSCRDEACADLATAAANGRLLWTEGSASARFCAKGLKPLTAIDLTARDEEDVE